MENVVHGTIEEISEILENELYKNIDDDFIDEVLDSCDDVITIGNLTFYPSQVLRNCDPVAYNMAKNDMIDSELSDLIYELECDGQVEYNNTRYIIK